MMKEYLMRSGQKEDVGQLDQLCDQLKQTSCRQEVGSSQSTILITTCIWVLDTCKYSAAASKIPSFKISEGYVMSESLLFCS